jgi:hypothetical protein
MPNYLDRLNADPLPWLLEEDDAEPGVRYFALRWLRGRAEHAPEVVAARDAITRSGPVARILEQQASDGHWGSEDSLHRPGWAGTGAQLGLLADLGADGQDARIHEACHWAVERGKTESGGISDDGRQSGIIHCLNGDVLRALIVFGHLDDAAVRHALGWLTDAILGTGDPQYRASGTSGPGFACAHNAKLPCAWGAVKALRALAAVPPRRHTAPIRAAIEAGVEFLLEHDLDVAAFPTESKAATRWQRFAFPSNYQADLLELLFTLAELRQLPDPRTEAAIELVLAHQDEQGRWPLESTLNGRMVTRIEQKGEPSKWLTLRALRVLRAASD